MLLYWDFEELGSVTNFAFIEHHVSVNNYPDRKWKLEVLTEGVLMQQTVFKSSIEKVTTLWRFPWRGLLQR